MALSAGDRLGPYEILAPLGAGGMGEVYRARDPRLDRDVAVKVVRSEVLESEEARRRFEGEAHAVAALSHPNVVSVHDFGNESGRLYIVMELLTGETLRERLERGALPWRKAAGIAAAIADGLGAAHGRGIVHRDLKPANVFLTPNGQVKVLDFGLAKTLEPLEPLDSLSPTQAHTATGRIVGTRGYMSPEQVAARPVDTRSDIFSLGCTLYEMVSGHRAFERPTGAETMAAILNDEPSEVPEGPLALRRLVARCLEKEPEARFQSARDLAYALWALAETAERGGRPDGPAHDGWRALRWGLGVMTLVAGLLGGAVASRWFWSRTGLSDSPPQPIFRSQIELTAGRPLLGRTHASTRTEVAVSPDGTLLVWASDPDPEASRPGPDAALELRRLDTGQVTRLSGTEGGSQPFFSPDGRWIGFFALDETQWRLRKVSIEGGLPIDLGPLPAWPQGGAWAADGRIYLGNARGEEDAIGPSGGIAWIPADGGPLQSVTSVDVAREVVHALPHPLPGGRAILFTALPHWFAVRTSVQGVRLPGGERKLIVEDAADARYLATGHLVFARQGVLMAAPFDPERLELLATPVPVISGVAQALNQGSSEDNPGASQFAVSETGLAVYAAGGIGTDPPNTLVVVDETGASEPLPGFDKPLVAAQLHLSPDGRRLAFVERASSGLAWTFDLQRRTHTALSRTGIASAPSWSPDGNQIALVWSEAGPMGIWLLPADGRGERELLAPQGTASTWSPDGRYLAFCGGGQILLYRFADRRVVPFISESGAHGFPEFSPDGRWLAYTSDENGRKEVYLTAFPERDVTVTVSDAPGSSPAWSRDGKSLYYVGALNPATERRPLMVVDVAPGPPLSLGRPRVLFETPAGTLTYDPMRYFDILPDGRFLFGVAESPQADVSSPRITRLEVIQNWFAELERQGPTERR